MSDSPEAIRADIESTRRELGLDVDALADKVTPSKIVHRQTDKVRGVFGSVRERIMGAADDAGSSVHGAGSSLKDAGSSVAGSVTDAGHRAVAKAEGNPLAVGLIAFGAGLLAASLIPATAKEKDVAATVKDQAQPLVDEAKSVAQEVGQNIKEPAQEALSSVKETATDAVSNVKDAASGAAQTVGDRAGEARQNVAGQQ
jgi:autotransporter adhesin